ncbi:TIGR02301 family protein [Georhizobium profundi]|uniref:TIGR02301 family protein n=1 Tax=Georhizobium profundi TaxID=2341112 RepID=UPI003CCB2556
MPHSSLVALLLAVLILLPVIDPSAAQEPAAPEATESTDEATTTPQPTAPPPPEVPYDDRLIRLSEIVGSVHYLQALCRTEPASDADDNQEAASSSDESDWRALMEQLIAAEAPEAARSARLTAAFNRGYRSFASVYTRCTPSAEAARARYRSEGATLASEIIARFGN